MNRIRRLLLTSGTLLMLTAGICFVTAPADAAVTPVAPLQEEMQFLTPLQQTEDERLMAVLWVQRSAEYRGLSYQAYNLATMEVDKALAQPETGRDNGTARRPAMTDAFRRKTKRENCRSKKAVSARWPSFSTLTKPSSAMRRLGCIILNILKQEPITMPGSSGSCNKTICCPAPGTFSNTPINTAFRFST